MPQPPRVQDTPVVSLSRRGEHTSAVPLAVSVGVGRGVWCSYMPYASAVGVSSVVIVVLLFSHYVAPASPTNILLPQFAHAELFFFTKMPGADPVPANEYDAYSVQQRFTTLDSF